MAERYPTVDPSERPQCIEYVRTDGEYRQCTDRAATTAMPDGRIIAVNTPYCSKHASEFHADRLQNDEYKYGG